MKHSISIKYILLALLTTLLLSSSCSQPSEESLPQPQVRVFFNEPGSRADNRVDFLADQVLIDRINSARSSIDCGIYGFSNEKILNALIQAHLRGVEVRVAGDARHFKTNERGYRLMQQNHIPIQVGNEYHIMHNKLFIIDHFYVFAGTGNITPTGFERNDNNWVLIEHPGVAKRFSEEFEQMFSGKFTTAKERQNSDEPDSWVIGDTKIQVFFSPKDDTMGRMLSEVKAAEKNLYFTIFAFTKDQLGAAMVNKHREFMNKMTGNERNLPVFSADPNAPTRPYVLTGILDRSQVQGNYLYHEVYRMISQGVPMMVDSNENSYLPGDYQAGGGRLHSKTMVIDHGTDRARILTGSFNWSSAATIANDEFLLIMEGERITNEYYDAYKRLWLKSKPADTAICHYYEHTPDPKATRPATDSPVTCAPEVKPGDVVISEIHWAGWNGLTDQNDHTGNRRKITNDEFIELYNTTDQPIDLSLWTINNDDDVVIGFTPGTIIEPKSYFLILDHNTAQYSDNQTLDESNVVFQNPDFVVNSADDPRLPSLHLNDQSLKLKLISPAPNPKDPFQAGTVIDEVGDGLLPFAGRVDYDNGREIVAVYAMERHVGPDGKFKDGVNKDSWYSCDKRKQMDNSNIAKGFQGKVFGTPGRPNCPPK